MIGVQTPDYVQSSAGFLLVDMQQNMANHINPSSNTPLILAKPNPLQGQKPPVEFVTLSIKDVS